MTLKDKYLLDNKNKTMNNKELEISLQSLKETKDRLNDSVDKLNSVLCEVQYLEEGFTIGKLVSTLKINLIDLDDNINEVEKYVGED